MTSTIFIVEDDQDLRKFLTDTLIDHGFSIRSFSDGLSALNQVEKVLPDLVVLDLGLPTMTGESVCAQLKAMFPELPVIILTARDTSSDMVKGFDLGADDYVAKPFEIDVLIARIKARLNQKNRDMSHLQVGDLILNNKTMEVKRGGKTIPLTPQEYKLLEYLMKNQGIVLTREMILNRIWSMSADVNTRVVDVYIGYLRTKIDKNATKKLIHTKQGFGYMLADS